MNATLKNLTIRQAAAACLFMAFLTAALLVILKTVPMSLTILIGLLFLLFMLFIGIGTVGTVGFLLWIAPDRIIYLPVSILTAAILWVTDAPPVFFPVPLDPMP